MSPELQEALGPLAQFAGAVLKARDDPATDAGSRRGAVKLLKSLQLARLALEYQDKFPMGMETLEQERFERFGNSHEG